MLPDTRCAGTEAGLWWLADEPTGNLDPENGERVFDLLLQATRERRASLVLARHDRQLAARCDRTLTLVKVPCRQSLRTIFP